MLADTPFTRALIGQYIDVFDYPDGRIEIRADGTTLPMCAITACRKLIKGDRGEQATWPCPVGSEFGAAAAG